MPESRRVYTAEFKVAAVKLVTEQGRAVAEAARRPGITDKLLRQWKKALTAQDSDAFPGTAICLPPRPNSVASRRKTNACAWSGTS